jgi:hypothetical protein
LFIAEDSSTLVVAEDEARSTLIDTEDDTLLSAVDAVLTLDPEARCCE